MSMDVDIDDGDKMAQFHILPNGAQNVNLIENDRPIVGKINN